MPLHPEGAEIGDMTQIADKLRAQSDDVDAADFYQRALQRTPGDARARRELAEIFEAHDRLDEAALQYRQGLALAPQNSDLLKGYARILLKQGQTEAAKEQYEKVLRSDNDDIVALNGFGVALDILGNHVAAEKAYREALEDKPDDIMTLTNLGHSYVLTGAYDKAIQLLEPHAGDKAATPTLRQNLAEAYGLSGMEVDAERMARMDLTPDDVKRNLAYYRAERAKLTLEPGFSAELGHFATEALAETYIGKLKGRFPAETHGLLIAVQPEVSDIGGTPTFVVRVSGFAKSDKLRGFCRLLKKAGMTCIIGSQ